jgi:hypothetical protein
MPRASARARVRRERSPQGRGAGEDVQKERPRAGVPAVDGTVGDALDALDAIARGALPPVLAEDAFARGLGHGRGPGLHRPVPG